MAVFTPVSLDEIGTLLDDFALPKASAIEEVAAGTENSTFFVTLESPAPNGEETLVLTLFEQGDPDDLPFVIALLDRLDAQGLPVPGPLHDPQGKALHTLKGRPALLFPRLPGEHPNTPALDFCQQAADYLARQHQATTDFADKDFPYPRPNARDLNWLEQTHEQVLPFLSMGLKDMMQGEITRYREVFDRIGPLPQAALHGDLFRDNTLFRSLPSGRRLTGVIDFYNGCVGERLFDLAILINDWCVEDDGQLDQKRYDTMLAAYQAICPFTPSERKAWPWMLRMTALRYWLSRLLVVHVEPQAHQRIAKDPEVYRRILHHHIRHFGY